MSFSTTSSLTMTLAGAVRPVGGGTFGGAVSTASTGWPCGGPKSPLREPPESEACGALAASSDLPPHPLAASAANATARNNVRGSVATFIAYSLRDSEGDGHHLRRLRG